MRAASWLIAGAACAFLALGGGCGGGDSDDSKGGGGSGGAGTDGGSSECKPTADICYVSGPEGPGNACLAKADFSSGDVTTLRLSSHQVVSPNALAQPFMQDSIVTKKSALNEPECNLDGLGQFNYLMKVDTAKSELTIGGGVPQALIGTAKDGTCWADFTDTGSGLAVKPVTQTYTKNAEGKIEAKFATFVMPIYIEDKNESDSYVLVPLHEMTFTAKLSDDKNCVGRFAPERLNKGLSCQPNEGEFAWDPAGRYEGYITVTEADKVMVVSIGETLCVVLTGDPKKWKGTDANCATSTGFSSSGALPKGDWCSTTNSADGCQDSWHLVIDFAAQAINIKGSYDNATGGC